MYIGSKYVIGNVAIRNGVERLFIGSNQIKLANVGLAYLRFISINEMRYRW